MKLFSDGGVIHEVDTLILFGEQLRECANLLRHEREATGRLALVCVDNLAEVVLWNHAQRVFTSARIAPDWMVLRRYSGAERRDILKAFSKKVELACRGFDGAIPVLLPSYEAALDEQDAGIFRVAHDYRNAVYHEDRHNSTLLHPLGVLYLQAVARSWCRVIPSATWWSSDLPARADELSALGASVPSYPDAQPTFNERLAAKQIASHVGAGLEVERTTLAQVLADDITDRSARADEEIASLRAEGLPDEEIDVLIRSVGIERAHADDPQLVKLDDAKAVLMEDILRRVEDEPTTIEEAALRNSLDQMYRARMKELNDSYEPDVDRQTIGSARRRARRFSTAKTIEALLQRYRAIDSELASLEELIDSASSLFHRLVQERIDYERGK